ncbi:MAG: hypothetical protein IKD59_04200, partial [Lachnospiraceae bacterium]|nr:hypothetical protein [Lachnospiraceae bacterium]
MSEWIRCPKCGTLMIVITAGHICPLCYYRVPAQTLTTSTGTSVMMRDILSTISDSPEIEVIQCKDCARSATCFTYRETGDGEGFCK